MKGKFGIILCCLFFLLGEIAAQKTRKYTTKRDIQHTAFDSIVKHSFKNKILIASSCDTALLIVEMSTFKKSIELNDKDPMQLICDLGNFYHAWMILTLCRNQSLIRTGNDERFYLRDTIILDKVPYTLKSLRESIISLGLKSKLQLTFSLWNGTKSGANPPKKTWSKQSLKAMILSAGKAFFKNTNDEFTADLAVNTLCISEKIIQELDMSFSANGIDINVLLPTISQYLPDHISAYCALNKAKIKMRVIPVSDILARSP
jgi:hypothetical protein